MPAAAPPAAALPALPAAASSTASSHMGQMSRPRCDAAMHYTRFRPRRLANTYIGEGV